MPHFTQAKEAAQDKMPVLKLGKFNVRIINVGDNYGLHDGLVNKEAPFVEFFDSRYPDTQHGQFVSRYLVSTLANHVGGLILDGGFPDEWSVSASDMAKVRAFIA